MRLKSCRLSSTAALLGIPLLASIPFATLAQELEEILVTATRRVTNLQDTPISIQAFTAEDLELAGITQGSDLGIMVPNVVLNPGNGGGQSEFYVRGTPGVGIYVDGVWQGGFGFQQTNFVEMERVEVLRGPQGTLFGRNTNGGAVNMTTRRPGDEFGARVNLEVGEFNRRNMTLAVDVPISDTLKTKFMGASLKNDGFLESLTVPRSFGDQDDTLFRADVLWEPTDRFSMRFTANDEDKTSSDARITNFSNLNHARYIAYNVLAGNPDYVNRPGFVAQDFGLPSDRFTPETHEPGFPGGVVGEWQTRSDTMEGGIRADLQYYTMTLSWDITDNLALESITSAWELDRRQVIDFDGSEFTITTDDIYNFDENTTQEFHLTGSNFEGRVTWLAGLYYLDQKSTARFHRWGMYEFAIPNTGPADPAQNIAARDYVRSWGAMFDPDPLCYRPRPLPPGAPPDPIMCVQNFFPLTVITADDLTGSEDQDEAFFGEVVIGLTEKLDVTLGVRITSDEGRAISYLETDGFRQPNLQLPPQGDVFGGTVLTVTEDADLGNITTNKFALTYQMTDDLMMYASWGEGFTSGGLTNVNNVGLVLLNPEVVVTRELGLRSDWRDGTLRFNATYFDSSWDGMRVDQLPPDGQGGFLPFPYPTSDGLGNVDGFEIEVVLAASDRWRLNAGLGLVNTSYRESGAFDGQTGIAPDSPFAYAPDNSASLGVQYDLPLSNGNHMVFAGNYGWTDKYVRDAANQRTERNPDGTVAYEPAYGILNARVMLESQDRNWNVALWGTNLTDERYINGGFDARFVWGYDFSLVGRAREVGVSMGFTF